MAEGQGGSGRLKRYAAEFLVVFLGVWLSLLAEQWRQGAEDRSAERLALQGIVRDLEVDLEDMTGNLTRAQKAFAAASWLVSRRSGPSPSEDSVALALTEIGPCSFPQWNASQYSTLKSSGDLNIIRDEGLRSSIARYYEYQPGLDWLHEGDCAESSTTQELLTPFVTLAIPRSVDEFSAEVTGVPEIVALFRDPVVLDRVAKLAARRQFLIRWIEREVEQARGLQGAILTEMEARWP